MGHLHLRRIMDVLRRRCSQLLLLDLPLGILDGPKGILWLLLQCHDHHRMECD